MSSTGAVSAFGSGALAEFDGSVEEARIFCLLMYVSASVSAPAMDVIGESDSGVVSSKRVLREERRASLTWRKGR